MAQCPPSTSAGEVGFMTAAVILAFLVGGASLLKPSRDQLFAKMQHVGFKAVLGTFGTLLSTVFKECFLPS